MGVCVRGERQNEWLRKRFYARESVSVCVCGSMARVSIIYLETVINRAGFWLFTGRTRVLNTLDSTIFVLEHCLNLCIKLDACVCVCV